MSHEDLNAAFDAAQFAQNLHVSTVLGLAHYRTLDLTDAQSQMIQGLISEGGVLLIDREALTARVVTSDEVFDNLTEMLALKAS